MRNFLVAVSLLLLSVSATTDEHEEDASPSSVEERLQPFGKSCLEGEDCGTAAPAIAAGAGNCLSASEIYAKYCTACHETGVSEAPLLASDQWDERVEKGMDVLFTNSKNGLNLMPAMGLCMDCSDAELQAAIDYLITGEE